MKKAYFYYHQEDRGQDFKGLGTKYFDDDDENGFLEVGPMVEPYSEWDLTKVVNELPPSYYWEYAKYAKEKKMISKELRQIAASINKKAVSWSKGHFTAIAEIIKSIESTKVRKNISLQFAAVFEKENPRFNEKKFLRSCGVTSADEEDVKERMQEIED